MPQPTSCGWNMWQTAMKMYNERKQLQELLAAVRTVRKPALRRSESDEYLLATDLPAVTDAENLRLFTEAAENEGWAWTIRSGWLLLDMVLKRTVIIAERFPESEACAGILKRHPERRDGKREWRELYKACEQGGIIERAAFRKLHSEMAIALREHKDLPELEICWKEND